MTAPRSLALAFSGGLDTSYCVPRLAEQGWVVHTVYVNTGGADDAQRAAIRAMQDVLAAIARDGNSRAVADRMASFTERETIVGTADYLKLDREDAR